MAVNEWVMGEPTFAQDDAEWIQGGPFVEIDNTTVSAGDAGIMTLITGYWGPTYNE